MYGRHYDTNTCMLIIPLYVLVWLKDIISHNKDQGERNHNQYYIQMETILKESHNKS